MEFYPDAPFLKDAPLCPPWSETNHIGVHTLSDNSVLEVFKGTQQIEKDLIKLVSEELFNGDSNQQDGYVATGGTEANIQAMWIYRNFFQKEYGARIGEIGLVYSQDSHYSMPKGANLLNLTNIILEVDPETREITKSSLESSKFPLMTESNILSSLPTCLQQYGSVDDIDMLYFLPISLPSSKST